MLCLSHICSSETTTRQILSNPTLVLEPLALMCSKALTLSTRAGVFMLLYAISSHPVGAINLSTNRYSKTLIPDLLSRLAEETNESLIGCLVSTLTNLLTVHQREENKTVWIEGKSVVRKALGFDDGGGVAMSEQRKEAWDEFDVKCKHFEF